MMLLLWFGLARYAIPKDRQQRPDVIHNTGERFRELARAVN
jgi:hypothetical protein